MTAIDERKLIGKRIEEARKSKDYSLQEVADSVGVARSTIQRYEKGLIENIKIPVITAIAEALSVNPSWLVGKSDNMYVEKDDTDEKPEPYYTNPETARIAQEVFDDPDLRLLFDAARDVKPENIRLAAEMLRRSEANESRWLIVPLWAQWF